MIEGIGRWTLWRAALTVAATVAVAGCGGGDSGDAGGAFKTTAIEAAGTVDIAAPDGGAMTGSREAASRLAGSSGEASDPALAALKVGEASALRPLAISPFQRENTYRVYAANGMRKLLRLDFANQRYEMLDDGDVINGGNPTSGTFSEDPTEPGTYIFATGRSQSTPISSRFRVAQGAVVGGFAFEVPLLPAGYFRWAPFIGANDFIDDKTQLDGEYTRTGTAKILSSGYAILTSTVRISGGGSKIEVCAQGGRLDRCQYILQYAVDRGSADHAWKASAAVGGDTFEFRMARMGGKKVWLEGGLTPANAPAKASLLVGMPSPTDWPSSRYMAAATDGSWRINDVGQKVLAVRLKSSNGGYSSPTSASIYLPATPSPDGLRLTDGAAFMQNGVVSVSVPTNLDFSNEMKIELGLFKEALTSEPPSPANGTYRVFTLNGVEHTLALDVDAGTYRVTDDMGNSTSGTFTEDPADPGTYIFASPRISMVYNTARFRLARDAVVGAFPFAAYGSNPVAYKTLPFIAARTFMTSASALAGTYEVLPLPGSPSALRINASGTTAIQCLTLSCNTTSDPVWLISAGAKAGQWVLANGSQQLRIYVAKVGARLVLLSSATTIVPTIPPVDPPLIVPIMLFGSRQIVEGVDTPPFTATFALHTASSTSFGKATISASSYSQEHLDQSGTPYPLTLNLQAVSQLTPSVKYALDSAGSLSALTLHNEELFVMYSITGGMYVGSVDR